MSALPEGTLRAALAALVLIAAAAALQRAFLRGAQPASQAPAIHSPAAASAGEGPVMDLNHLRAEDLAFLESIFRDGTPEGRLSAARALASSGDMRGVPMLFEAARRHPDESLPFCLGALEILRLQRGNIALREIILALESEPALSDACRAELSDRFGVMGRVPLETLLELADEPAPLVRAWLARRIADEPGDDVDRALLKLAADPDRQVRHAAWLAWIGRDTGAYAAQLTAIASSEADPDILPLAREVTSKP